MYEICILLIVLFFECILMTKPPNIVFILVDDLGWNDVSYHGSSQIPTPNIDALSYSGIMLNNYYVQPICTPSRAALLTGRHPIHIGLQSGVILGSQPYALSLKEKLLPAYLKDLGYKTHMVGKWHIGYMAKEYTPTYRGFDSHFGFYGGCDDYWDHSYRHYTNDVISKKEIWGLDFWENGRPLKTKFGKYSTEIFSEKACDIIDKHDTDNPLFLYLAHQAPHNGNAPNSVEAPWEYLKKFSYISDIKRRTYAAMVSALDDSIGSLTRALKTKGILNNTIIVFSTDNGGPCDGFSANYACNEPLRGMKYTLWEGGIRGNGFIWSSLLQKRGYKSNHMMQIQDWLPTLLYVSGYNMSKLPVDIDGLNIWEALSQNISSPRTEMLHNYESHSFAYRSDSMKIKFGKMHGHDGWYRINKTQGGSCIKAMHEKAPQSNALNNDGVLSLIKASESYKSLESYGYRLKNITYDPFVVNCGLQIGNYSSCLQRPCLFNISIDPCEFNDISTLFPDITKKLMSKVVDIAKSAVKPRNKPLDVLGLPIFHSGIWSPWIDLSPTNNSILKTEL